MRPFLANLQAVKSCLRPARTQHKSTHTCMRLTTSDGRFVMANFFSTFPIFCGHSSKFTCHPIFLLPDRKNRCRKSDVGCRKSESDTCKEPNIDEKKGKDRCRKSAVACRKPHTCVRTLTKIYFRKKYSFESNEKKFLEEIKKEIFKRNSFHQ